MKRLFILLFSIVMAGEMTVDGNLTVADTIYVSTIQSATIDSLLSLIAQLEMRIAQLECQNTGIIPDGYCDCFFHTLDECGVCNGDTTSCQDCAGVPNGDNLQDMCGYCDNDASNDCVQDCNGQWGGSAVEDVCGDCGGDAISEDECNLALYFNGDDEYVSTPIPYTDLYGAAIISISASIKWLASDNDGGPSEQGILSNASSQGGMGHQISLLIDAHLSNDNASNKLSISWENEWDFGSPAMDFAVFDTLTIEFGQWYNVKVELSNNFVYWYLDNELIETDEVIFTTLAYYNEGSVPDLNIGRGNRVYDTYFNGQISNLVISINNGNIIGNWNFNEGAGSSLNDISGNNNNGTLVNMDNSNWVQVSP